MRILLADDHPMIRTALEALLRGTAFEIVGIASTGEQALAEIDGAKPDILLLDLQMPGGTGMDVLRQVRSNGSKLKIVLLTAAIDDASLVEAKTLRVQGMVLKNSDPAYLLECLERVGSGGRWIDPELAERSKKLSESLTDLEIPALTPRERQLINLVRKGMRNREIAEELGVTEGTIKVYMHAIFEKVGVSSRTELAIRADEFLTGSFLRN
jgi:two-component system nitrate/nitrite response regulator NarL